VTWLIERRAEAIGKLNTDLVKAMIWLQTVATQSSRTFVT
jgi:hypothetical protein